MAMRRMQVGWQTGVGGSGVSVFYSPFGVDMTTDLATFFNALKAQFPTVVTWDIPGSGDVIDEVSGKITGAWTAGTAATITATGAGNYAGGTGAYIKWQTAGIVNGHRVRGRTFLVPIVVTSYDAQGTIAAAAQTLYNTTATTLAATGKMLIWHRPTSSTSNDGSSHPVVAGSSPDKVTSLRTRRT